MTAVSAGKLRAHLNDYVLPAVGLVPMVMLSQVGGSVPQQTARGVETAVYKTELVGRVDAESARIRELLSTLSERKLDLADLTFVEPPAHAPYQDAYEWELVDFEVMPLGPDYGSHDESPEIWR